MRLLRRLAMVGKFDGADANIADKVYIIDMDSSSTNLEGFKPQLFNDESDFMNYIFHIHNKTFSWFMPTNWSHRMDGN